MKKLIAFTVVFLVAFYTAGYSSTPYAPKNNSKTVQNNVKNGINVNDPGYKNQWAIKYTNSDKAWKVVEQKRQITVAVVDSGVDYSALDLKNRLLENKGYNFVDNTRDTMDDYGHGTAVAGIIAAQQGNNEGVTGVVGPLDVKIIPVKVLDKNGEGDPGIVAKGIIYAADVGADIINISIDFDQKDELVQKALIYAKKKGSLVVVAAGNSNSNCDLYSPSGDKGAYTVSSLSKDYKKSYFSSYGTSVNVAAPGEDVLTTELGSDYDTESGTSMAAPIVSGVAAMIKAQNPNLNPDIIAKVINSTAMDVISKGKDKSSGYGLVNAYKAVLLVKKGV